MIVKMVVVVMMMIVMMMMIMRKTVMMMVVTNIVWSISLLVTLDFVFYGYSHPISIVMLVSGIDKNYVNENCNFFLN